jgi:hypothetical protein
MCTLSQFIHDGLTVERAFGKQAQVFAADPPEVIKLLQGIGYTIVNYYGRKLLPTLLGSRTCEGLIATSRDKFRDAELQLAAVQALANIAPATVYVAERN